MPKYVQIQIQQLLKLNLHTKYGYYLHADNSNTTLVKVKLIFFIKLILRHFNSNTTLVKVKLLEKIVKKINYINSNTTLVKVK